MIKPVVELSHPLVAHHLTQLRNKETTPDQFRSNISRLSSLLAYEATSKLELEDTQVETPLQTMTGKVLKNRIGIIPIIRAGLGMVDPILGMIPEAEVWHLGFYRDETTLQPVEYYKKIPASDPVHTALVVDPMLATGGSALAAIRAMKN